MSASWMLAGCGAALLALALWIIVRQRRAASCRRHDPRAGAAAMVLAAGCLIAGLILLQIALWA